MTEKRTNLPPCFQPKVYVCPRPDCHYIGSADEKDIHVFGPESAPEDDSGVAKAVDVWAEMFWEDCDGVETWGGLTEVQKEGWRVSARRYLAAIQVFLTQPDALRNLIGRAWEVSVALEGHNIEPELRARLDEALAAIQAPEAAPADPQLEQDLDEAISVVERCAANGTQVAPGVAYSLRDAFGRLAPQPSKNSGGVDWNLPERLGTEDQGADLADELRTAATHAREEAKDDDAPTKLAATYERAGMLDEAADVVEWAGDQIEARSLREVPGNSGGVEEGTVEATARWLREAEQAHPGPMGAPYGELHPPQRKEPYRKQARSLLGQIEPLVEAAAQVRLSAAGFLRRRTVLDALGKPVPTQSQLSDEDREELLRIASTIDHSAIAQPGAGRASAFLRKLASQPVRDDAVPVVRAEPGEERIDFELECGHIVGLVRADVASFNSSDELELPTALVCPACLIDSSQPQQQPEEDCDDLCDCGHERFHHDDGREMGVYTNCKSAGCTCPAFRQQHGEVEEDGDRK